MNKQMTLEQAIQNIRAKFTSGNSVPVERATITATEWAAIDAHLNAHPTSPDVVRDAARYRWLRDVGDATWTALSERMPHYNIDRAIDAAMAAREGGE